MLTFIKVYACYIVKILQENKIKPTGWSAVGISVFHMIPKQMFVYINHKGAFYSDTM